MIDNQKKVTHSQLANMQTVLCSALNGTYRILLTPPVRLERLLGRGGRKTKSQGWWITSRKQVCSYHRSAAHRNSLELCLSAQDLFKLKLTNLSAWREGKHGISHLAEAPLALDIWWRRHSQFSLMVWSLIGWSQNREDI